MNFISKINKYLIERFPTIWNTKIVWILLICLPIHGLFFLVGANIELPYYSYGFETKYFSSGWSFVGSIISMLILVGWLVSMLKNNAFKSFYPISNIQLFGQFLSYFIIIFCATSFYLSCKYGFYNFSQESIENPYNIFAKERPDMSNHIVTWRAFAMALLLFNFRVTNLRTVLFAIVSKGFLGLIIGLLALIYGLGIMSNTDYFTAYLVLFLGFIILYIPIFMPKSGSKLFRGILINMSILGFVPYVLLILSIISMHQKDACREIYSSDCFILLQWLDSTTTSWILLTTGFIFLLIYTSVIKKWRALPE